MHRLRHSRVITALVAIVSMLFMHLAVAGYACPDTSIGAQGMAEVSADVAVDMTSCHEMDGELPNLCGAHAQSGKQSLDKPEIPAVPPFVASALSFIVAPVDVLATSRTAPVLADSALLERITAPPFAIRHCCFRI